MIEGDDDTTIRTTVRITTRMTIETNDQEENVTVTTMTGREEVLVKGEDRTMTLEERIDETVLEDEILATIEEEEEEEEKEAGPTETIIIGETQTVTIEDHIAMYLIETVEAVKGETEETCHHRRLVHHHHHPRCLPSHHRQVPPHQPCDNVGMKVYTPQHLCPELVATVKEMTHLGCVHPDPIGTQKPHSKDLVIMTSMMVLTLTGRFPRMMILSSIDIFT
jgi:hypothetical protein